MNVVSKPIKEINRIGAEPTAHDGLLATVSWLQPLEACAKLGSGLEGLTDTEAARTPEEIRTQSRRARAQGHNS